MILQMYSYGNSKLNPGKVKDTDVNEIYIYLREWSAPSDVPDGLKIVIRHHCLEMFQHLPALGHRHYNADYYVWSVFFRVSLANVNFKYFRSSVNEIKKWPRFC